MPDIEQDLQRIMQARYGREVRGSIHDAISDINDVADNAESVAITSQASALNNATLAESYAKGGTGSRTGEDTDNAEYYYEKTRDLSDGFEVIDNLTSTSTTHSLSANMGRELKSQLEDFKDEKGEANGYAELDSNGRVPYSQLPESAMEFKGTWNASTNTPTLTQGVGTNGDFYVVSVGGTWQGITFIANDRIIFNGDTDLWIKLVAGEVNSVNGMSGVVVLNAEDIEDEDGNTIQDFIDESTPRLMVEGGTTGQVLAKASNEDYDAEWVDNSAVETITYAEYLAHKEEYDASNNLINISDIGVMGNAQMVGYNNETSGLSATNVQSAIDEVARANNYSTNETRIGTWIDGKPLYRKMVDFGALPSNSTKTVALGISNVAIMYINLGKSFTIAAGASYTDMGNNNITPLATVINSQTGIIGASKSITIGTNYEGLNLYKALVCVEYTKTTD